MKLPHDLLPCPFCGNYPPLGQEGQPFVLCQRCLAVVPGKHAQAAAQAWNRRKSPTRSRPSLREDRANRRN
jgi:hypothetical protein